MSDRNKVNLMSKVDDAVCGDVSSSSAEILRDLLVFDLKLMDNSIHFPINILHNVL